MAVARQAPDADVKTCPGWKMVDLVGHTGAVHRWVTEVVRTRATERPHRASGDEVPASIDTIGPWYEEGLNDLVSTLATTSLDLNVWNWAAGHPAPVGFWFRRMAQETVVHRCDAQNAAGQETVIDTEVAVDGIEEWLGFVTRQASNDPPQAELSLVATDVDETWHLGLAPGLVSRQTSAGGGDLVRGPASELYLWLLHRPAPGVSIVGEGKAVEAWGAVKFE